VADSGIKKVIIKKEDFPPLAKLAEDVYGHFLRYRIVSEDRNKFSHWSEITPLTVFSLQSLPPQVVGELTVSGSSVTIVWDDEVNRPRYDVFVSFDGDPFFYHGTSPIHTYSIIAPAGTTSIEVVIQIESIVKEISQVLTICELDNIIES
jgi:hypothetical protein